MGNQIYIDQKEDHIGGKFEWEIEPVCGRITEAVADKLGADFTLPVVRG